MRRQPSCLTCARLLHSILFQRPIRSDYEMDYPRASDFSTRGSQARGTRLSVAKSWFHWPESPGLKPRLAVNKQNLQVFFAD